MAAIYPATLLCDFYKISHIDQYPENTEVIYSTWTPRKSRVEGVNKVVAFGMQYFAKEYLMDYFQKNFFDRPLDDILEEYVRVIKFTLGVQEPKTEHIKALHSLGYLPLRLRAVKEGTLIPMRVPMLTIENTLPEFYWLTNYLESLMSAELWQPSTAATLAHQYRKLLDSYAIETTGSTAGVEFQAHDFSFRGMEGLHGATNSAAGHLLSFVGTDSIPGILFHEKYYGADIEKELVGTSIPATEHSVMCANANENQDEMESFRRLLEDVYPEGIFSVVSDSYDFWKVVGEVLPALKDKIMARDGKMVIRPDSGDPILIITGDPRYDEGSLQRKGLIECLWDIFGGTVNEQGYKVLDPHIGAIYGDSITPHRAERICFYLKQKGFASTNIVFGVGSYTYQYNTRDTFGFAMKATWSQINSEEKLIFKDPKTDDGTKRSQRGRVVVCENLKGIECIKEIVCIDGLTSEAQKEFEPIDLLETIFEDGKLLRDEPLSVIRERLAAQ